MARADSNMQKQLFETATHYSNTPITFETYKKLRIRERATLVDRVRHNRARKLFCVAMGFSDDSNFPTNYIHNVHVDIQTRTGCMAGATADQIRACKIAVRLLGDWSASRLANRIYNNVIRNERKNHEH